MNTIVIDMIDGMRCRLMIVLRGRVMSQSLPQRAFSKAMDVGLLYIRCIIRILIYMAVSLYVYVGSSIALLYNIYYKVITIGDVMLCEDARINGGMGGIWYMGCVLSPHPQISNKNVNRSSYYTKVTSVTSIKEYRRLKSFLNE